MSTVHVCVYTCAQPPRAWWHRYIFYTFFYISIHASRNFVYGRFSMIHTCRVYDPRSKKISIEDWRIWAVLPSGPVWKVYKRVLVWLFNWSFQYHHSHLYQSFNPTPILHILQTLQTSNIQVSKMQSSSSSTTNASISAKHSKREALKNFFTLPPSASAEGSMQGRMNAQSLFMGSPLTRHL